MKKSILVIISVLLAVVLLTIGGCTKTTPTTTTTQTSNPVTTTKTTTPTQTVTPTGAPLVSSTTPDDGATGVHINDLILATFSERMTPSTINTNTFSLWKGTTPLDGVVSYDDTTAILNPAADLEKNTIYTVKITTSVKDLAGVAMAANYQWSFTTGDVDTVAPAVVGTIPSFVDTLNTDDPNYSSATFPINNSITAIFNDDMDPATINNNTFTLMQGTIPVDGTVIYDGIHTAVFNPTNNLIPNTVYTAKVTTGVTDSAGNPMQYDFTWNFTTGPAQTTIPTVISTTPAAGSGNMPINNAITATFSEAVDPMTITDVTFSLWQGNIPVPGTVDYDGLNSTAVFTPLNDLTVGATYTATITADVTDLSGIHLASDISWSFTTANADTSVPSIISMSPADGATGVPLNSTIKVTFSEAMDPTSIILLLQQGTNPIPAQVTYDDNLKGASLTPDSLTANTVYTVMITGGSDLAGFGSVNASWSFTTASQ